MVVEQADINPKVYGTQGAGGSTSIPRAWDQLRQAGAGAKAMLVAAAAKQWNVDPSEITAKDSTLSHAASGKTATYGSLGAAAAKMPVPDPKALTLKTRSEYRLMGKRHRGVDDPKVVTGKPLFGIDVQLPDMVYATYTKCPAAGGKVKSANLDEIKALPGVIDAFVVEGNGKPTEVMPGVAIIGKDTWTRVPGQGQVEDRLGRKRGIERFHDGIFSPREKTGARLSEKARRRCRQCRQRLCPSRKDGGSLLRISLRRPCAAGADEYDGALA